MGFETRLGPPMAELGNFVDNPERKGLPNRAFKFYLDIQLDSYQIEFLDKGTGKWTGRKFPSADEFYNWVGEQIRAQQKIFVVYSLADAGYEISRRLTQIGATCCVIE